MTMKAYSRETRKKIEEILIVHVEDMRRSGPWSGENAHVAKKIMKLFK
jgi:hypothetical protein|tara:strand:- start:673 stop:816 length:144 start_codon:yes stop_codon:yes gene_type:complete